MVSPKTIGWRNFHSRIARNAMVSTGCLADQAGGDRHAEQSMGDRPAERAALARGMVDVQRIEVPGQTREQDNIRFRDGPSRALPFVADRKIIECQD